VLTYKSRDNKKNYYEKIFRKVAFGIGPNEELPSDPFKLFKA
jgi:hypothetical protein